MAAAAIEMPRTLIAELVSQHGPVSLRRQGGGAADDYDWADLASLIPIAYQRRYGMSLDEMAMAAGFERADDLVMALRDDAIGRRRFSIVEAPEPEPEIDPADVWADDAIEASLSLAMPAEADAAVSAWLAEAPRTPLAWVAAVPAAAPVPAAIRRPTAATVTADGARAIWAWANRPRPTLASPVTIPAPGRLSLWRPDPPKFQLSLFGGT